jgi:hypothetical protein
MRAGAPVRVTATLEAAGGLTVRRAPASIAVSSQAGPGVGEARFAIDGIAGGVLEQRWHSALSAELPHWLAISFPERHAVHRVVIDAVDGVEVLPARVALDYRTEAGEWAPIGEFETDKARQFPIDFDPVETDGIRVTILKMHPAEVAYPRYGQLSEIEVYAQIDGREVNIVREDPGGAEARSITLDLAPGEKREVLADVTADAAASFSATFASGGRTFARGDYAVTLAQ